MQRREGCRPVNLPKITIELEPNHTGPYAGRKACLHIGIGDSHRWISPATARQLADKVHDLCDRAEVLNGELQRPDVH